LPHRAGPAPRLQPLQAPPAAERLLLLQLQLLQQQADSISSGEGLGLEGVEGSSSSCWEGDSEQLLGEEIYQEMVQQAWLQR
jgi:hypothetical protein